MKDTSQMDALLRQMASSGVPVESAERSAARRERVVSNLEHFHTEVLDKRGRLRSRRVMLAAAAALLLMMGGWGLVRRGTQRPVAHAADVHGAATLALAPGGTLLGQAGGERAAVAGGALAPGDTLHTTGGAARLVLSSGAEVAVADATELRYEAPQAAGWMHESLRLDDGRVDVHVPKLPAGGTFDVMTPDAVVEVHGTRFSVIVDHGATQVAVTEGRVEVRSRGTSTMLGAGDHWASRRAEPAQAVPVAPPSPSVAAPQAVAAAPAGRPAAPVAAAPPAAASTLAQQNRLFQQAMDARRRGDDRRAVAILDQLLARFPGSPLAEDARVERFRALKRLGQGNDASREARRYLADHPEGFARDEARDVALEPAH